MSFDVNAVRADFPILSTTVNGRPLVYLDSGASAQKPQVVIDAISAGLVTAAEHYSDQVATVLTGLVTLATQTMSEFALHARAILGLPVDVAQREPAASAVIYGGMEAAGVAFKGVAEALAVPTADLRLFGKPEAFARRRMGVATARGADVDEARDRAPEQRAPAEAAARGQQRRICRHRQLCRLSLGHDLDRAARETAAILRIHHDHAGIVELERRRPPRGRLLVHCSLSPIRNWRARSRRM